MIKKYYPYIYYILIFFYLIYHGNMHIYNTFEELFINTFLNISHFFYIISIFILMNIYSNFKEFLQPVQILRYRDGHILLLYKEIFKEFLKMLFMTNVLVFIYALYFKLNLIYIAKYFIIDFCFLIFEISIYTILYSINYKKIYSILIIFSMNILFIIVYTSMKYANIINDIAYKWIYMFVLIITILLIILNIKTYKLIKERDIL